MTPSDLAYGWLAAAGSTFRITDPGNAGTYNLTGGINLCPLTSSGTQTRTLAAPTAVGQVVVMWPDSIGTSCTVTINGGATGLAASALFNGLNDVMVLIAVTSANTAKWAAVSIIPA